MRIIGTVPHPHFKISVFQNDGRWSIKFENGLTEQLFRFRDGEGIGSLQDAIKWVDAPLLASIELQFEAMHSARLGAVNRFLPEADYQFEEII